MAEIEIKEYSDGRKYKVLNGTYFYPDTDDKVCHVLEEAIERHKRIRVFYCYPTEESVSECFLMKCSVKEIWLEAYATIGNVSRTCGKAKMPILCQTSRSCGGSAILTDHIAKIVDVRRNEVLYALDGIFCPAFDIEKTEEGFSLLYKTRKMNDFKVYARAKDRKTLERLWEFLIGLRHGKGGR